MKTARRFGRVAFVGAAFAAMVLGTSSLFAPRVEANPIVLLCGATLQWECTSPDGSVVIFGGTLCEARRFERRTGSTCTPF